MRKVTEAFVVERYSHVMHIVSEVTGQLQPGLSYADVLRATFPAGTVSGAPKIRALEVIRELEPIKRNGYAGSIGYITQALGGSYTVFVEGNLFRVAGRDADAIGKEPPPGLELPENAGDEVMGMP